MPHHIAQGKMAEQRACDFLNQQGLTTITRNFRCRYGEIDLIMQDQDTMIFVEVRYRHSQSFGGAIHSISRQKQQRLITTAHHFLEHHTATPDLACRFDLCALNSTELTWIPNAFAAYH